MIFDVLSGALQLAFIVFMAGSLMLLVFSLLLAWGWGQFSHSKNQVHSLTEILSIAGVEWGALMTLAFAHLRRLPAFFEAPRFQTPEEASSAPASQIPICLIPSLHWSSRLFRFLYWRLKAHHFKSLWPMSWKFFLQEPLFLEEQLFRFLLKVQADTGSTRMTLISFGSSRPIIARVLARAELQSFNIRWIAISASQELGSALEFIQTPRLQKAYATCATISINPHVLIAGAKDTLCYPLSVFGEPAPTLIADVGHYGALLHSKTIDTVLSDLDATRMTERHQRLASKTSSLS